MLLYDRYWVCSIGQNYQIYLFAENHFQIPSTVIPFYVYPEVKILHISQSIAHSREHIACLNLWVDNGSPVFSPAGASQSVGWGLGANWIQFPCGCSRCLFHSPPPTSAAATPIMSVQTSHVEKRPKLKLNCKLQTSMVLLDVSRFIVSFSWHSCFAPNERCIETVLSRVKSLSESQCWILCWAESQPGRRRCRLCDWEALSDRLVFCCDGTICLQMASDCFRWFCRSSLWGTLVSCYSTST